MDRNGETTAQVRPGDSPIELVCFDLGEVLMRLCAGWEDACRCAGLTGAQALEAGMRQRLFEIVQRSEVGLIDQDTYAGEVATLVGLNPEQVTQVSEVWLRGPYPGVDAMLGALAEAPVRTACLSNTNALHWELMTTPGHTAYLPLGRLDYRFASHLIGERKPDAAIYQHVEQAAGVPAEAILFFDNAPENVAAAKQRGWQAVQVDPADPVPTMRQHLARCGWLEA